MIGPDPSLGPTIAFDLDKDRLGWFVGIELNPYAQLTVLHDPFRNDSPLDALLELSPKFGHQGPFSHRRCDFIDAPAIGIARCVALGCPHRQIVVDPNVRGGFQWACLGIDHWGIYRGLGTPAFGQLVEFLLRFLGAFGEPIELGLLLGGGEFEERRGGLDIAIHGRVGVVVEECVHRVELARAQRIEFMIVAHRTSTRKSEEGLDGRTGAIDGVSVQELVVDRTPFGGRDVASVKTGGDQLRLRRVLEQIARKLLDGELIEGHIAVESIDDPIAVGPDLPMVIQMQTMGVSIACHIEPVLGHLFAEMLGGKIPIDEFFVSILRGGDCKLVDILDLRG